MGTISHQAVSTPTVGPAGTGFSAGWKCESWILNAGLTAQGMREVKLPEAKR